MKVALFTIWHVGNYGADLQTCCLAQVLRDWGHEVEVIDLRLSDLSKGNEGRLKLLVWSFVNAISPRNIKDQIFFNRFIPRSRRYYSAEEVKHNPPVADLYLVGSDQVWNPSITKQYADIYFLNFDNLKVPMASYASSFGTDCWNGSEELTSIARRQLALFKKISCREMTGVGILQNVFGVNAENVIDPSLLVSTYNHLLGDVEQKPIIAYYPLSKNDEAYAFCLRLSKETSMKVRIANWKNMLGKVIWNKASMRQWLRTIAEATLVITPSFHGLTTCLTLRKQFVIVITEPLILERSSRIRDLLKALDLEDRLFTSFEDAWDSRVWETEIDYNKVEKKLSALRDKSLSFLHSVLE